MKQYVTVKTFDVITQIAEGSEIEGYTVGVLEIFFPDDSEINAWNKKEHKNWIESNNKRMTAICNFLNEKQL